jgi:predicted metal-dependent phosphoesterase TrpH
VGSGFIDLHSHTNESDGTSTPGELIRLAQQAGLDALSITDHDTFEGYEKALPYAREAGLELVRGIELNTRLEGLNGKQVRYMHLLAYFPVSEPTKEFQDWLREQRDERRSRNEKLAASLREHGVDIRLEEVVARGRSLAGRPHFARILVEKGYAASIEDAFNRYLGEEAPSYVQRESKTAEEAIAMVRAGRGIPVIAHPVRLGLSRDQEREVFAGLKQDGALGLEVYHSEHPARLQAQYVQLAKDLDLLPTGGSDFHGSVKPNIELGSGLYGNVRVPREFLDGLRTYGSYN